MRASAIALIAMSLAAMLIAAPARAQAPRTFVSAAGSDSNTCTNVATPCRHLAAAYAATLPNGEIFVLDPANYGSLTITYAVSIEGHGWASIAPAGSGSAAITINAGTSDKINIIGVVLDGTGISNTNGIVFNSGGSLTVRDSVIRNFGSTGIQFLPNTSGSASWLFVANTLVADSGFGLEINASGTGATTAVVDHVQMTNNAAYGLQAQTASKNRITVLVTDSVSADNGSNGIMAVGNGEGVFINFMVRNSTIANNGGTGLVVNSPTNAAVGMEVTRSTITGNNIGWTAGPNPGLASYGDCNIDGNNSVNSTPGGPAPYE
jgi:hypothetical protein